MATAPETAGSSQEGDRRSLTLVLSYYHVMKPNFTL
jgi:hypothetical protein